MYRSLPQESAVGSGAFIEKIKAEPGIKAIGCEVTGEDGIYNHRGRDVSYNTIFVG